MRRKAVTNMECSSCIYQSRQPGYGCDYIGKTGRSKVKAFREVEMRTGRKPEQCPVRATKREKVRLDRAQKEQAKASKMDTLHVDAIQEMAERGMSDGKIAEELGVARKTIFRARKKHRIPAGIPPKGGWTSRACISR